MSRRRNNNQEYTRLPQDDGDGDQVDVGIDSSAEAQLEGFTASQFARPKPKIPYKAILLSCFLFVVGSVRNLRSPIIINCIIIIKTYSFSLSS